MKLLLPAQVERRLSDPHWRIDMNGIRQHFDILRPATVADLVTGAGIFRQYLDLQTGQMEIRPYLVVSQKTECIRVRREDDFEDVRIEMIHALTWPTPSLGSTEDALDVAIEVCDFGVHPYATSSNDRRTAKLAIPAP